jgi:FkbM family methyltransferase
MLISYAQNREDLYLWALVGHRSRGTYVDVGCNDERVHSVTKLFYDQGWSGLNIDANDAFAAGFAARTRDVFVVSGVGAEAGELTFRQYDRHNGLSTFDEVIKSTHEANGYPFVDKKVLIRTLTEVLDDAGISHIDFLKIDVEGMEPEVLQGLDLRRIRPSVIVAEAMRAADCETILFAADYRLEFFDGLNVYYVDNAATDVTIHSYSERVLKVEHQTALEHRLMTGKLMSVVRLVQRGALLVRAAASWVRDRFPRLR